MAAVAAALVLILPAGSRCADVAQAAALSLRGPAQPAPAITHGGPGTRLGASVNEVYFPDWHATLGWRAVGQRTDTLSGRRAVTVYYQHGSEQVAYTIVATPPLPEPSAEAVRAGSLTVRALSMAGARLSPGGAPGTPACCQHPPGRSALAALAAWSDQPGTA